jgi:hypothetical protein
MGAKTEADADLEQIIHLRGCCTQIVPEARRTRTSVRRKALFTLGIRNVLACNCRYRGTG